MDHLVFLDAKAGELEKILSGIKTMILHAPVPSPSVVPVQPGDTLYFIRDNGENAVRVKAKVVRILLFENGQGHGLAHRLKEMQVKLQLTEAQYYTWMKVPKLLFVEFDCAQKIPVIHISLEKIAGGCKWISTGDISLLL